MGGVPLPRIRRRVMVTESTDRALPESAGRSDEEPEASGVPGVVEGGLRPPGRLLRWALTIGLLALVATQVNVGEVAGLFGDLHWAYILLALALVVVERVVATLRWWVLLRVRGIEIEFGSLLVLHLTAGFAGSFLPTSFGVDAVRIVMLTRRAGRRVDCIAASVVDRLVMVAGTIVLAAVMTGLFSSRLPLAASWIVPLAAVLCVGVIGLLLQADLIRALLRVAHRFLSKSVSRRLEDFYWAVHAYNSHSGIMMIAAVLTGAILLVRIVYILALGLAVGAEAGFVEYLLVMPLAAVLTMLPISVGGFGLQEGVYAALMGLIGVTVNEAITVSLLDHATSRSVLLVGAVLWLLRPGHRPALDALRKP